MKGIVIVGILVCASFVTAFALFPLSQGIHTYDVKAFSSYDELFAFLKDNYENFTDYRGYYDSSPMIGFSKSGVAENSDSSQIGGGSYDFSETNIQVEGVDEQDFVKTDGTYIYVVAD